MMKNYFDKNLSLSISVPDEWRVGSNDNFELFFISPADPATGYRTNIGFSAVHGSGQLNAETFQQIIDNSTADFEKNYHSFQKMFDQKLMIDELPAYLMQYQWQDEISGTTFAQIVCLIATAADRMLEIHGATLKSLEGEFLPILIEVVESIRVIPIEEIT